MPTTFHDRPCRGLDEREIVVERAAQPRHAMRHHGGQSIRQMTGRERSDIIERDGLKLCSQSGLDPGNLGVARRVEKVLADKLGGDAASGLGEIWEAREFEPFMQSVRARRAYGPAAGAVLLSQAPATPAPSDAFLAAMAKNEATLYLLLTGGERNQEF
jgi:hypothetical protein